MNMDEYNAEVMRELYEKALGIEVVKYMETLHPERMAPIMESQAVMLLAKIKAILDDDAIEDPECFYRIDAIVNAFHSKGLFVDRHDC